jgi:hypothetical protein
LHNIKKIISINEHTNSEQQQKAIEADRIESYLCSTNNFSPRVGSLWSFFYKDTKFMDEREFRLIIHSPENHAIGEQDVGQKLSIDPVALIKQIVVIRVVRLISKTR